MALIVTMPPISAPVIAGSHRTGRWLFTALAAYFALQIAIRTAAQGGVDIDEGEQVVLSQWWQAGYGHQPPLYTWLQIAVFEVLGRNVLALAVLKNALLLMLYVFAYAAGRAWFGDERRVIIGSLGLLLLPQVAWASQRDLTHSVLAMAMSAAMLWSLLLLMRDRTLLRYAQLGAVVGLGLLAKYNVLFAAIAVFVGALATKQGRAAILRPSMLITLLIAAAVVWPHARWLAEHHDILRAAAREAGVDTSPHVMQSLVSIGWAAAQGVGPLLAVVLLVFGVPRRRGGPAHVVHYSGAGFASAVIVLLAAIVLALGLPHFKVRWLQPALALLPLVFASWIAPARLTPRRMLVFVVLAASSALAVLTFMTIRTVGERWNERYEQHEFDFDRAARDLRTRLRGEPLVIVSNFALIAGNLKLHFPQATVFMPGVHDEELVELARREGAVIAWERNARRRIPDELLGLLQRIESTESRRWPVRSLRTSADAEATHLIDVILLYGDEEQRSADSAPGATIASQPSSR